MKVYIITGEPFPNGMAATNRIKCYSCNINTMVLKQVSSLIILSLLSLMKSSTTTSTPNLLLMVLLFLEHLTTLSVILSKTELIIISTSIQTYSSKTIFSFELLNIFNRIIDESETSRTTTTYTIIYSYSISYRKQFGNRRG